MHWKNDLIFRKYVLLSSSWSVSSRRLGFLLCRCLKKNWFEWGISRNSSHDVLLFDRNNSLISWRFALHMLQFSFPISSLSSGTWFRFWSSVLCRICASCFLFLLMFFALQNLSDPHPLEIAFASGFCYYNNFFRLKIFVLYAHGWFFYIAIRYNIHRTEYTQMNAIHLLVCKFM